MLMLAKKTSFQLLTLPLRKGYSKWFVKISVCVSVSDSALPQKLDTPGLPYLACIHSSEVARTSTHYYFLHNTRSYQKGQESR